MSAFLLLLQVGRLSMRNLLRTLGFSISLTHTPLCPSGDVWKAPKMGKMGKTGKIAACVRGLRACAYLFSNVGACACVSVCTQSLQHDIRCLPWLRSIIFPEVGSFAEEELDYFLPSCSVDPWTLDYTWATIFICLAFFIWGLQIQCSPDLCSKDFGHQVITPGPFCF